ncbi:MAG: hypothetical protein ACLPSW_34705 [Roseiarcus sp.]
MSEIRTWSALQFEAFDALKQAWDERREMDAAISAHAGGMQWKTVKGRVYLVRNYVDSTGVRRFESLGVKSPETERRYDAFMRGRRASQQNAVRLDGRLHIQAAVAKASKIGRTPAAVGEFFRALSSSPSRDRVILTGSMSLLAYEIMARGLIPTDLLALPGERPDLDLIVEEDADVDEVERLFRSVSPDIRRSPGAHRTTSPTLTIDAYTRADLQSIADQVYEGGQAESFLDAIATAPMASLLVDRSGQPAPARVLPIKAFVALKAIRRWDAIRGEALSALDARHVRLATAIAENIEETNAPEGIDEEKFFAGP